MKRSDGSVGGEFAGGLITALPITVAAMPIGLLFGALAAGKGLSPLEAGLMSMTVFAGASQFVAIDMWHQPVPWVLLGLTALTVNLRHVMMGASISRHFQNFGPLERWFYLFFLTDEVWAFSERRVAERRPFYPAYFAGLAAALWFSWVASTLAGTVMGAAMGPPERYGFDFIFTALFIGLIIGFWKGPRTGMVIAVSALAAIIVHQLIAGPWYILCGGLAGTAAGAATLPRTESLAP